jgi:predicted transcriptional regulator of viral defense system
VLEALAAPPGSSSAAVAEAVGISPSVAAATISRLVRQGRVRRLDQGGYAVVDTPADDARNTARTAPSDEAAATRRSDAAAAPAPPSPAAPG